MLASVDYKFRQHLDRCDSHGDSSSLPLSLITGRDPGIADIIVQKICKSQSFSATSQQLLSNSTRLDDLRKDSRRPINTAKAILHLLRIL